MCVSMCLCVCQHVCVCVSMCVFSVQCVSECVQCVSECVHCTVSVNSCRPPLDLGPLIIMISKFYFLTIQNIGIMFSCFKTQIYFFFHQKTVYLNIRFLDNGTSNQVCFDSTAQVYCLYKVQVPPTPLQSGNGKSKFLNFWFGKTEYLHFHNI